MHNYLESDFSNTTIIKYVLNITSSVAIPKYPHHDFFIHKRFTNILKVSSIWNVFNQLLIPDINQENRILVCTCVYLLLSIKTTAQNYDPYTCIKKRGRNLLFPYRWKLLCLLVVASKAMNPALNQNQPKLRIFILSIPLQMLPYWDCFLDEMVQILRNFRSKP